MRVIGKRSIASGVTVLLNIAWYVVGLALVLTLFVLTFALVAPSFDLRQGQLGIPASFSVDTQALHVAAPALGVESARIDDVRGTLKFSPQSRAALVPALLALLVMLVVVQWVIGQLRAVFRSFAAGRPFEPANARRIRSIGFAVIAGEVARAAVVFSSNWFVMTHFRAEGLHFGAQPDLNMVAIVNGVIILVIAEVFRTGSRLDDDQSLTI